MVPIQPPFQAYRGLFLQLKWLGSQTERSPPSSAQVKNEQSLHGVYRNIVTDADFNKFDIYDTAIKYIRDFTRSLYRNV